MDFGSRRFNAASLVLLATLAASGCLPRGPIPATLSSCFPACDGPDCCQQGERGERCRGSSHAIGSADQPTDPALMAPHPSFNPVPTRPVFAPWSVEEDSREPGTLITWSKGLTRLPRRSTSYSPYDPPAETAIAERPTLWPSPSHADEKPILTGRRSFQCIARQRDFLRLAAGRPITARPTPPEPWQGQHWQTSLASGTLTSASAPGLPTPDP